RRLQRGDRRLHRSGHPLAGRGQDGLLRPAPAGPTDGPRRPGGSARPSTAPSVRATARHLLPDVSGLMGALTRFRLVCGSHLRRSGPDRAYAETTPTFPTRQAPVIRFDNVTKTYMRGQSPAVENLDIEFSRGEFVFLVGASGSAKSTLMRMI